MYRSIVYFLAALGAAGLLQACQDAPLKLPTELSAHAALPTSGAEEDFSAAAAVTDAINAYIQQQLDASGGTYPLSGRRARLVSLAPPQARDSLFIARAAFVAPTDTFAVDVFAAVRDGRATVTHEVLRRHNSRVVDTLLFDRRAALQVVDAYIRQQTEEGAPYPIGSRATRFAGHDPQVTRQQGQVICRAHFTDDRDRYVVAYQLTREAGHYVIVQEMLTRRNDQPVQEVLYRRENLVL